MKKLNLLLTIFIGIIILSCSSSDENDNENNDDLIGTWYGISSTLNGNNSGIPDNSILRFTSDNRVEFVYENSGNNGEDISEFGDWTKNENLLTINWDDSDPGLENYILEILELNESTLKWRTEINGEGTLIETFSKNQNATVDLNQFPDYELAIRVESTTMGEPFEFQAIYMTTNGDNVLVEDAQTYSGVNCCTDTYTLDSRIVKEYKVVGVKIIAVTGNISWVNATLTKVSDQNEVMDETGTINNTAGNSATIIYNFETNTATVTEN